MLLKDMVEIIDSKMFVNEKDGVVVCVVETNFGKFRGRADCSPKDTFNSTVGKKIAYNRALRQANAASIKWLKESIISPAEKLIKELKSRMDKSANIISEELNKLNK